MTHINLDTQPEIIRQFVLELSATPEGAVLESAGQLIACLLPPPTSHRTNGEVWTLEMNQRRCALLDRKYDQGLTTEEEAELALLQDAMYRYVDRVAPLPLDDARRLHQELLSKVNSA
jgi:hypothetical protein